MVKAGKILLSVVGDLLPIVVVLAIFQGLVLRRPVRRPMQIAIGLILLIAGLALVLHGLENTVFPLGRVVAEGLAAGLGEATPGRVFWLYLFIGALGFAAALAEPVLTAVVHRATQLSSGAIRPWGLRLAVATGIGLGACLGLLRMMLDWPLFPVLLVLFVVLYLQAQVTPRMIVNLALDAGVVTISTVTAPCWWLWGLVWLRSWMAVALLMVLVCWR